ncbi:hypothetical protein [Kaarinaea lacus]
MQFTNDFQAVRNHATGFPVVIGFSFHTAPGSVTPHRANFALLFPFAGQQA